MRDRFVWKWPQCVSERARIQHIGISQRFGVLLSVQLAFGKLVSTGLTFSASAIALAPSTPMELRYKCRLVRTALTFRASAIALAPSSRISFSRRSRVVRTLLKTPNPVAS